MLHPINLKRNDVSRMGPVASNDDSNDAASKALSPQEPQGVTGHNQTTYAPYQSEMIRTKESLIKFLETNLPADLQKQVSILLTGSCARGDCNPQNASFDLIVVYDQSKVDSKRLKAELDDMFKQHADKFLELNDIEYRCLQDNLPLHCYQDTNGNIFSIPTRFLYAVPLLNPSKDLFKKFYHEITAGDYRPREFWRKKVGDSIRQLRNLNKQDFFQASINAKELKHSTLRSVQNLVAHAVICCFRSSKHPFQTFLELTQKNDQAIPKFCTFLKENHFQHISTEIDTISRLYFIFLPDTHLLKTAEHRDIAISQGKFQGDITITQGEFQQNCLELQTALNKLSEACKKL